MGTVFFANTNDAELATLSNTFAVAGVATDPSTISLTVVDPQQTSTTYTYSGGTITRTGTGVYTKDIACDLAGIWTYAWVGTGTASDVVAGSWTVQPTGLQLYGSLEELKSRFTIPASDADDDFELLRVCRSIQREINQHCHRVFTRAATATARRIPNSAIRGCKVDVPDFWTAADLVVEFDTAGDGTFATATTDFELLPIDGIVDGEEGWPFNQIEFYGAYPSTCSSRPYVRATAKWGWAEVPEPVHEAFLILAAETFKLESSPFGVGGYGQFGIVKVRDNPMAARKLQPFVRDAVLVG